MDLKKQLFQSQSDGSLWRVVWQLRASGEQSAAPVLRSSDNLKCLVVDEADLNDREKFVPVASGGAAP